MLFKALWVPIFRSSSLRLTGLSVTLERFALSQVSASISFMKGLLQLHNDGFIVSLRGRIIAIDTSISIYQLRTGMPEINNRNGENISLFQGLFYRTVSLLENDIKPVYVFDGRPPDLKQPLLARRAEAAGVSSRTPVVGAHPPPSAEKDCETLLRLLGVPFIQGSAQLGDESAKKASHKENRHSPYSLKSRVFLNPDLRDLTSLLRQRKKKIYSKAPCEAEATCAALVASGRAWCTATEDMDALPFGSTRVVRHLNAAKNCEVEEYSLPDILEHMKLTRGQFVDLCILLGCDYIGKIRGLGPKKVLKLLQEHGSIEEILKNSDPQKHPVPEGWRFQEARALFLQPSVVDVSQVQLEWTEPDEEKLVNFLSHQKHIKEHRVRSRLKNMHEKQMKKRKAQQKQQEQSPAKRQMTMSEFFAVKKASSQATVPMPQCTSGRQRSAHMGLPSAS